MFAKREPCLLMNNVKAPPPIHCASRLCSLVFEICTYGARLNILTESKSYGMVIFARSDILPIWATMPQRRCGPGLIDTAQNREVSKRAQTLI